VAEAIVDTASASPVVCGPPGSVPTENGRGSAFIGLAALGSNSRRSYIVSLLRIVLYPHAFLIAVAGFAVWLAYPRGLSPVALVVLMFGYVIAGGVAVVQSVARTHRRPWRSLISVGLTVDRRRLAIGVGVQAILAVSVLIVAHFVIGQPLRPMPALPVALLALLLTPLQAASEEMVFRGYLTQALGRIFHNRVKIVVVVSVLFAVMHWNTYGPLTMPYMFLASVILSVISLRDEGLELTIGAHAAMNWLGLNEIGALASGQAPPQVTWLHFPVLVVGGLLLYALTRLLVRLLCGERKANPLTKAIFQAAAPLTN
jgi:membrane protease YdiL (CAAX protease family)